jgi:hypothetical protein
MAKGSAGTSRWGSRLRSRLTGVRVSVVGHIPVGPAGRTTWVRWMSGRERDTGIPVGRDMSRSGTGVSRISLTAPYQLPQGSTGFCAWLGRCESAVAGSSWP